MADETPPADGTGGKIRRDLALVGTLAVCVVASSILAGLSMFWQPAQWDLVDKVVDGLQALNLLLAGGLLRHVQPK